MKQNSEQKKKKTVAFSLMKCAFMKERKWKKDWGGRLVEDGRQWKSFKYGQMHRDNPFRVAVHYHHRPPSPDAEPDYIGEDAFLYQTDPTTPPAPSPHKIWTTSTTF